MKKQRIPVSTVGIALSGLIVFSLGTFAAVTSNGFRHTARDTAGASTPLSAGTAPGRAAQRIQIDPETGELVPLTPFAGTTSSPEAALSHSVQGLSVRMRPDGSRSVDLEGRFMESTLATTDPSGRTVLGCLPEGTALDAVGHSANPAEAGRADKK